MREIRTILVPTDFSSHSGEAIGFATGLAKSLGKQRMPAEPPRPCGGRLRIHFPPPVCHNELWLRNVLRSFQGGVGHAYR